MTHSLPDFFVRARAQGCTISLDTNYDCTELCAYWAANDLENATVSVSYADSIHCTNIPLVQFASPNATCFGVARGPCEICRLPVCTASVCCVVCCVLCAVCCVLCVSAMCDMCVCAVCCVLCAVCCTDVWGFRCVPSRRALVDLFNLLCNSCWPPGCSDVHCKWLTVVHVLHLLPPHHRERTGRWSPEASAAARRLLFAERHGGKGTRTHAPKRY